MNQKVRRLTQMGKGKKRPRRSSRSVDSGGDRGGGVGGDQETISGDSDKLC